MAVTVDNLQERWDRLAPRERNLVGALAITFVVCVFGFVTFFIRDRLVELETRNDETREALVALAQKRETDASGGGKRIVKIPEEKGAIDLENHLAAIAKQVGVVIPGYDPKTDELKDGLMRVSLKLNLGNMTLSSLSDFLQKVEANPLVVISSLHVRRNFRDQEKVEPNLEVFTLYKKASSDDDEDGN